jgi:hypothetical protein
MPAFSTLRGATMIIGAFDIVLGVIAALLVLQPLARARRAIGSPRRLDRQGSAGATHPLSDDEQ